LNKISAKPSFTQGFHGCERCVQVVNATRELEGEKAKGLEHT